MNPNTINHPSTSTFFFTVSLVFLIAFVLSPQHTSQAQELQQGISVHMPSTTGAAQLPAADHPDAWVVTVTANGDLYWGVNRVTPESLLETMKSHPGSRSHELYIKADGSAQFPSVRRALETSREDGFHRIFLLTEQSSGRPSGEIVPPFGMPLWIVPPSTEGGLVVQVRPGQGSRSLKVENEEVRLNQLQQKLTQLLQNRSNRVVVLRVGHVPFADVAHVIDVCNMAGAMPVLDMSPL